MSPFYRDENLRFKFKPAPQGASTSESDRDEELIVNPTLLDKIVCFNKTSKDRYVFHNITKNGYDWELRMNRGGQWILVWQIALTKKK